MPSVPLQSAPRAPFTVERYPAVGGAVRLVGFDANGEPCVDLVMPRHRYKPSMMTKLQEWIMKDEAEQSSTPVLRLG